MGRGYNQNRVLLLTRIEPKSYKFLKQLNVDTNYKILWKKQFLESKKKLFLWNQINHWLAKTIQASQEKEKCYLLKLI